MSREAELGQLEARAQAAHLERLLYRARLQSRCIIIIRLVYNNVHRSCKNTYNKYLSRKQTKSQDSDDKQIYVNR